MILLNFIKKYYIANNMLVAVSGNVEINQHINLVTKFFKNLKKGKTVQPPIYKINTNKTPCLY